MPLIISPTETQITVLYDKKSGACRFEAQEPMECHLAMSIFLTLLQTLNKQVIDAVKAVQAQQARGPNGGAGGGVIA